MIDEKIYWELYRRIKSRKDIERLSKKGFDKDFLLEILILKLGRNTKRKFYKLPKKKILEEWRSGKTIMELARKYEFSPVMLAYILLQELGYSKKKAKDVINKKLEVQDPRLKRELELAWKEDLVYSPEALEIQYKRGEKGEEVIKKWLDKNGVRYEREEELRKRYEKTPDFLLKNLIYLDGNPVRWIESKYSIGDLDKVKYDYRRQLEKYLEMFGPGAIIYHLGMLERARDWLEKRGILALEKLPKTMGPAPRNAMKVRT